MVDPANVSHTSIPMNSSPSTKYKYFENYNCVDFTILTLMVLSILASLVGLGLFLQGGSLAITGIIEGSAFSGFLGG